MKRFKKLSLLQKIGITLIVLSLGILGAMLLRPTPKSSPRMKEDLMIHDYVFENAVLYCLPHQGLHYIVPMKTESYKGSWSTFCDDVYRIRCQDDTLIELNTGASGACFDGVGHMQWEETLQQTPTEYYHL